MDIKGTLKNGISKVVGAVIERSDGDYEPDDMALIFSTIESHSLNVQSNITDYWLEDRTAIQDSIGLQPLQMTLSGLVADLEYNNESLWTNSILGKINKISQEKLGFNLTNKLSALTSLIPQVDNYTQTAKSAIKQVEEVWNNLKGKINKFAGNKTITNQQKQVEWLLKAWNAKLALKVTTPFAVFDNMYILSAPIVQENTNTVTKLQVTLKQLRFANDTELKESITSSASPIREAINETMQSNMVDNGIQKTNEVDIKDYMSAFKSTNISDYMSVYGG